MECSGERTIPFPDLHLTTYTYCLPSTPTPWGTCSVL